MLTTTVHLFVIPHWANQGFSVFVLLAAIWRGGWRERLVSAALSGEVLFTAYVCGVMHCPVAAVFGYQMTPQLWRPSVDDGVILAICVLCAIQADRYWSIIACSVALLGELCDLAIFLPGTSVWAVLSASLIFTYLLGFTVLWGVWSYRRAGQGSARGFAASGPPGRPPRSLGK